MAISDSIQELVTTLKSTFEEKKNKVTTWSSTTSDTKYPSEKLVKTSLDQKANSSHTHTAADLPATMPPSSHNHDDRYYTETETNSLLNNKSDTSHTHSEYINPTIADNLNTNDATQVLSAKQGKRLNDNKLDNNPSYVLSVKGMPIYNDDYGDAQYSILNDSIVLDDNNSTVHYALHDGYVRPSNEIATKGDISGKEDATNKSYSVTTDATSTTKYPTVKAVKDYVDDAVGDIVSGEVDISQTHNHDDRYYTESEIDTKLTAKNVTVTKLNTATTGYIATYEVKQGTTSLGKIDIPKDYLVKSGSVKTVTTANNPVSGYAVGNKYIDFVINTKDSSGADEHIYINVKDLIDTYTADNSSLQLSNNQFSVKSGGITSSHIADGTITSAKITDGTIVNADIASNATIAYSKLSGVAPSTHTHTDSQINFNGSGMLSPIDAALNHETSTNKIAFLPPNNLTVQYANSSTSNLTTYSVTDANKTKIMSAPSIGGAPLVGGGGVGTISTSDKLVVTVDAGNITDSTASQVYTFLKKIHLYFSTGSCTGCQVKVETADYPTPTTWVDKGTYALSGNPYWNVLPLNITFGGYAKQNVAGHVRYIKLTFTCTGTGNNSSRFALRNIQMFGVTNWAIPSNLASIGHIYNYNENQDAIFPAKIIKLGGTTSQFLKANGDVDSNTYIHTAGTGLTKSNNTFSVKYGNTDGTACQGADSRLSDTRTPTDNTVSTAKIQDGAVTSAKIANGTIVNADISTNAQIAGSKIADGTITSAKITDGTIVNADVASNAAIAFSKLNISKANITELGIPAQDTTYTAASAAPLRENYNGTVGTSTKYAREDHRHPYFDYVDNGTAGETGYIKSIQIKINDGYQDSPIKIEVFQRQSTQNSLIFIRFNNNSSTDPGLGTIYHTGSNNGGFWLYKESASTYSLIIKKAGTEAHDSAKLRITNVNPNISISNINTQLASLPTGTTDKPLVQSTYIGFTGEEKTKLAGIETGANKTTFGTTSTTACVGNDSRLSDHRIPHFTVIPANKANNVSADLNTYRTGGFYYINNDNNAQLVYHTPKSNGTSGPYTENKSFFLLVEAWGDGADYSYVKQTLTYYNTNETFVRTKAGSTDTNANWKDWVQLDNNNTISIISGDLNDYKTPGNWLIWASDLANISNAPVSGGLFVRQIPNGFMQIICQYGADTKMWYRNFYAGNSTWTSWVQIYNSGTIPTASTSTAGIVKTTDSVSTTSSTIAASATAVKTAYNKANHSHTSISASSGIATTDNDKIGSVTINGTEYSWYTPKLNDAINSTSTTQAATANAVRVAYNKGNHSHPSIANNLTTSTTGSVLDATQGKWLKDNTVQTAGTGMTKSGNTLGVKNFALAFAAQTGQGVTVKTYTDGLSVYVTFEGTASVTAGSSASPSNTTIVTLSNTAYAPIINTQVPARETAGGHRMRLNSSGTMQFLNDTSGASFSVKGAFYYPLKSRLP